MSHFIQSCFILDVVAFRVFVVVIGFGSSSQQIAHGCGVQSEQNSNCILCLSGIRLSKHRTVETGDHIWCWCLRCNMQHNKALYKCIIHSFIWTTFSHLIFHRHFKNWIWWTVWSSLYLSFVPKSIISQTVAYCKCNVCNETALYFLWYFYIELYIYIYIFFFFAY